MRACVHPVAALCLPVTALHPSPAAVHRGGDVHTPLYSRCSPDGPRNGLQASFEAVQNGGTIILPPGTCVIAAPLKIYGRKHVTIMGSRERRSVLKLLDPAQNGVIISHSSAVSLSNFTIIAAGSAGRDWHGGGRGIFIEKGTGINISGVRVIGVRGAGILLWGVRGALIQKSSVERSLADGFHVTGGSTGVTFRDNFAYRTGDDCFAAIGYAHEPANRKVAFLRSRCVEGRASGVAIEGTSSAIIRDVRVAGTRLAGIRIASQVYWSTRDVDNIIVDQNRLIGVSGKEGEAAILIYSNNGSVRGVRMTDNQISRPGAPVAVKLNIFASGSVDRISVLSNRIVGRLSRCLEISPQAGDVQVAGNQWNGKRCPDVDQ